MRVPVKLLGFSLWLFFLNCAQSQVCLREDIQYENTEIAEKDSYDHGETVKVNCMTGFTGMYKLKCDRGQWKALIRRPCAKKKCSHPGDATHGEFTLQGGTEFVFGATVVYTCKKGYEMTSRINRRTCRAQGWDNTVPVCEAVTCPAIQTNEHVTASGNTEEGSYGDVIHFECVSSDKKIEGSSDIHCKETGEWSDAVPTCKDITCTAPVISNGSVVQQLPIYEKDAILKYKCDPGFKPREGIPRCGKFGWTLNPECDEVTCELKSIKFGVKNISPVGQTIFRAGEKVEITCSEKYWFLFSKETSKEFECQNSGEWDSEPVCEEIRCEVPHDQYVSGIYYYFRGDKSLGVKKFYYCESGYRKTAEVATCTQDGWTPKPLCAEIMCADPNIPNAEIVGDKSSNYKINSRIEYKCNPGFEPEEHVRITCDYQGQWRGMQKCTAMCEAPYIPNAEILGDPRPKYNINSGIEYKCSPGFEPEEPVQITCDSQRQWTGIQKCTERKCAAPNIPNAEIVSGKKQTYRFSSGTQYKCHPGFEPEEPVQITCGFQGQWTGIQECTEKMCAAPYIPKAEILGDLRPKYNINSKVEYKCSPGFEPEEPVQITCVSQGQWTDIQKCTQKKCSAPNIPNAQIVKGKKQTYRFSSGIQYKCSPGFEPEEPVQITCGFQGQWTGIQECTEKMCAAPYIPNAEILGDPRPKYNFNSGIEYKCSPGFEPEEPVQITCNSQGQWIDIQECTAMCAAPYISNAEIVGDLRLNYRINSTIEYKCSTGFEPESVNITCNPQGQWTDIQKCTEMCEAPNIPNAEIMGGQRLNYKINSTIEYKCSPGFDPGESVKITCDSQRQWRDIQECTGQKEN